MFDRILGRFLVDSKRITEEQLQDVMETQDSIRVKLGVIAVSEKLMTIAQTEDINILQASLDMKFGELAVAADYLTEAQVKRLLSLQGNEYLIFIQTLIDKNYMEMKEIESALEEYQKKNGFMESEINALKSGEVDRIVPIFLLMDNPLCRGLFGLGVKTIYRLVDHHVAIGKSYKVDSLAAEASGYQRLVGMHNIFTGIAGNNVYIRKMAIAYTKEEFIETDEDALDAVCELINCINGIFATELSKDRVMVEMEPPVYNSKSQTISGAELYVLPLVVCGENIEFIVSADQLVKVG